MPKPKKTNAESASETKTRQQDPLAGVQVGAEMEGLGQLADGLTLQKAMANPRRLAPGSVPGLQRSLGNQYVQAMMSRAAQGDSTTGIASDVQTQVEQEHKRRAGLEGSPTVSQRKPDGGGQLSEPTSGAIDQQIKRGGKPLPGETRSKLKQNLGVSDPENIQVHTDKESDALSKSLGARAFTAGSHIFFQQGEYDPGSTRGQRLLYHESAHTMQQGATAQQGSATQQTPQAQMVVSPTDDEYEQEADEAAEQALTSRAASAGAPSGSGQGEDDPVQEADAAFEQATRASEEALPRVQLDQDEEKDDEEKEKEEEAEKKKEEKKGEADKEKDQQKKGAKEKGKDKGEEEEKKKEKKPKKVPKPDKPKTPEKTDKKLPLPESEVDVDEAKFDPGEDYEEPEMEEEMLPTWGELAAGTVQLSPEMVQQELNYHTALTSGDGGDGGGGLSDVEVGSEAEEGEGSEDVDKGAMIGDALAEGALTGLQEGATEFVSDQVIQAATSKIPYADGFINMAKIAQDPNQWFEDNVMAIGDGAKDMVKGFKAIGDEDTAWGYMAATLEAVIGIIDLVNQILGLINTIFTIILAISKALVILGNFMISLCPGPWGIFAWTPAVFVPIVTFFTNVIAFLDPINNTVSSITNILLQVKFMMQPLVILFRILDIAESKADPEKLKEKQEKLKGTTQGFVKSSTQKVANKAKDKASAKMQKAWDKRQMRKAEQEAEAAGVPKGGGEEQLTEGQQRAKDKLDAAREKYEASKKADADEKLAGVLPWKTMSKNWGELKGNVTKLRGGDPQDYSQRPEKYKDDSPEEYEKKRIKGSREEAKERTAGVKEVRAKQKELKARGKELGAGERMFARGRGEPKKTARRKGDEAETARHNREAAEAEYDRRKKISDNDTMVKMSKGAADESYKNLTAAEEHLANARKRKASKEEIDRLQKEVDQLEKEHHRRQDVWVSWEKQQQKNEKATQRAKQERQRRRREEREAQETAEKRRQYAKEYKQFRKKVKKETRAGWKQTWEDVGGSNLLSGGDMGGQRHGGGIIGFSGNLYDLIEEQTGVDITVSGLLDKFGVGLPELFGYGSAAFEDAVGAAQESLDKYEQDASDDNAATLSAWLGKIDDDEQATVREQIADLRDRAASVPASNSQLRVRLENKADSLEDLLGSAQAIIAVAATYDIYPKSDIATWAEGYGAEVFTLSLRAEGIPPESDDIERSDPEATVFVIKGAGEEVSGVQRDPTMPEATGGFEYDGYDMKVTTTSARVALYKNKSYPVEAKDVKMNPKHSVEETYEPVSQSVEQQGDDFVAVTVAYQEQGRQSVERLMEIQAKRDEESALAVDEAAPLGGETFTVQRSAGAMAPASDLTIQRAPAEDDEMDEMLFAGAGAEMALEDGGFEDKGFEPDEEEEASEFFEEEDEESDREAWEEMVNARYEASLLGQLPPPPEGVFEEIEGAAMAYREVDAHEYYLRLQQQDVAGLKQHGKAQLAQVKDTRMLTAANQQGVAAHQRDADVKLEAQDQMKQATSSKEEGAQKASEKSGGAMGALGDIFNQIMQGLGLGIGGGGGDASSAKSGAEEQGKTSESASQATTDATKIADKRTAETKQVKAEAAQVEGQLKDFDDQMGQEETGTQEGLTELDEAAEANAEQMSNTQEEKARLREKQAEAFGSADEWAIEHQMIREELMAQLEEELDAGPGGGAEPEMEMW